MSRDYGTEPFVITVRQGDRYTERQIHASDLRYADLPSKLVMVAAANAFFDLVSEPVSEPPTRCPDGRRMCAVNHAAPAPEQGTPRCEYCPRPTNGRIRQCCSWCKTRRARGGVPGAHDFHTETCDRRSAS